MNDETALRRPVPVSGDESTRVDRLETGSGKTRCAGTPRNANRARPETDSSWLKDFVTGAAGELRLVTATRQHRVGHALTLELDGAVKGARAAAAVISRRVG
jgi:hypothetical protein